MFSSNNFQTEYQVNNTLEALGPAPIRLSLRVPLGVVHTGTVSSASVREAELRLEMTRELSPPITSNKTAAISSTVNKSNYSRCDGWRE